MCAWTGKAKPAKESLAITDDQAFLEQVSQEKPEKEKESTRSRTAGAARTGSRASPAKSTGAGGDNLSTNAADFFGSLQKSGKVRSLSCTHLRHGTCGTSPSLTRTAAGPAPCGHSLACLCPSQARKPGTRRETIGVGKTLSQPDLGCLPVPSQPRPKLSDTRWVAQKPAAARAAGGGKAAKAAGKPAKTSSADAKDLFAAMQAKKKKGK